jgi:hypothetical protein
MAFSIGGNGGAFVDLVECDADGREEGRLEDIPASASAQEVILLERIDLVRALPACVLRRRLVARKADGERLLGEYIHTPSSTAGGGGHLGGAGLGHRAIAGDEGAPYARRAAFVHTP